MDLRGLSIEELHRRALAARQIKGAAEVTLMFLLAELEDREVYRDYGCSSIAHYAQFHLRLDPRKARETGTSRARDAHAASAPQRVHQRRNRIQPVARNQPRGKARRRGDWLGLARARTSNQIQRIVARVRRGQRLESAAEAGTATPTTR